MQGKEIDKKIIDAADLLYNLEVEKRVNEAKQKELRNDIHSYMKSNRLEEIPGYAYLILKVDNPEYGMPSPDIARKILGKNAEQFIEPEHVKTDFRKAIPPELAATLCPITKRKQYVTLRFKNEEKQAIKLEQ